MITIPMEFIISKSDLRHLAAVLSKLDVVVAVPENNTIVAEDFTHTRRFVYSPPGGRGGAAGDVGLDAAMIAAVSRRASGDTRFSITADGLVVGVGAMEYRLNVLRPHKRGEDLEVNGGGTIRMRAADLYESLMDVNAADPPMVVIAITKDGAVLRGEGGSSIECWVPMPGAEHAGAGYSRLSLDMLLECMPKSSDHGVEITLAPKGPTMIRFGDHMTYYQAPNI